MRGPTPAPEPRWKPIEEPSHTTNAHVRSDRLAVPGGWLYRTIVTSKPSFPGAAVSMIFVADPQA